MKKLYEFTLNKVEKVEETEVSTNSEGQEIKVTKTVDKSIPKKFFLKKPNRVMYDDAELFYSIQLSQLIKSGLLTRAQLATKFTDEATTITEAEKKAYTNNILKLVELENDYQKIISGKSGTELNEEEKSKVEVILNEVVRIRTEIADFENQQNSLFEHTAENRARNKTILWWVLNLAHDESEKPIYGDGTFENKIANYDKYEEEDNQFMLEVTKRFLVLVSFWYTGRAENKEDFDRLLESSFAKE